MSTRFNPPPAWRQYLPTDFVPNVSWTPEQSWGAPPVGWPMWIDDRTGLPVEPPIEYSQNPYLYMSVMPDWNTGNGATEGAANFASGVVAGKNRLSRGKKIGIGVVTGIVAIAIIGALSGGGDDTDVTTADSPSASPTEVAVNAETVDEPAASSSSISAAEESAKAEAEAKANAEASKKAEEEAKASEKAEAAAKAKAEEEAKASEKAEADAKAKAEAEAKAKAEKESGTVSQQNAQRKAADYLNYTAFSKSGLIDQLEFEGFSKADATWGVEQLDVDWNEQAALKAADYLDYTSFSKAGLIDQLVFEGFTKKQATYGAGTTGL